MAARALSGLKAKQVHQSGCPINIITSLAPFSHFVGEETDIQSAKDLLKVTLLVSCRIKAINRIQFL